MKLKLVSIGIKGCICIESDDKPINPKYPLWQEGVDVIGKMGSKFPGAFALYESDLETATAPATLVVTIKTPRTKPGTKFTLKGFHEDGNTELFCSKEVPVAKAKEMAIEVTAQYRPTAFFCLLGKNIFWRLTRTDNGETSNPVAVYLELYWLYSDSTKLPLFADSGIPIDVLRDAARACRLTGHIKTGRIDKKSKSIKLDRINSLKDEDKWIIESIVNWLFYRNPPRYDIYAKNSHFVVGPPCYDKITFDLTNYLKAIDKDGGSSNSCVCIDGATCNCEDQAAVLQYYLKTIGFPEIKYCRMKPFGYLNLTNLVGRGYTNNPGYGMDHASVSKKPIVYPKLKGRVPFRFHAFCYLKKYDMVVDSCVGPSTGEENKEDYVKKVLDDKFPPLTYGNHVGTHENIDEFDGVISTGVIHSCEKVTESDFTREISRDIETVTEESKNLEEIVVGPWGDPREWKDFVFNEGGWTFHENLLPGPDEVLKTWIFEKDGEYVKFDIYISSGGNELSLYRFASVGTSNHLNLYPIELEQLDLGDYGAKWSAGDYTYYLCVFKNVVFDVTCKKVAFNVKNLVDYLSGRDPGVSIVDFSVAKLPDLVFEKTKPEKAIRDDTVEVTLSSDDALLTDFIISKGNGLKLIERKEKSLLFFAHRKSINELVGFAVSKDNLLVRKKKLTIEVT